MPNTVNITVTAKSGPAIQSTATVFTGATGVFFNVAGSTIEILTANGKRVFYDYTAVATITMTISGVVTTLSIS